MTSTHPLEVALHVHVLADRTVELHTNPQTGLVVYASDWDAARALAADGHLNRDGSDLYVSLRRTPSRVYTNADLNR